MKDQIVSALGSLINSRLVNIGRFGNLEWFIFRPRIPVERMKQSDALPEYALNVYCAWRIVGPEGIVVASDDRYYPKGPNPDDDLEEFDWNVPGNNRCDERVVDFLSNNATRKLEVLEIKADEIGSLYISLSHNYAIEFLPDDSLPNEHWRFFIKGYTKRHFVVTGAGITDG